MKSYHAVILSILVHLLLFLSLKVTSLLEKLQKTPDPVFIEFRDEQKRYMPSMSDETRRVKKEMRTRDVTPVMADNLVPQQQQLNPQKINPKVQQQKDLGEKLRTLSPASENDLFLKSAPTISEGTRQQLQSFMPPDLEIGDMAALNTDQNIYYSFYRRMAEKVVWPWAQNVLHSFEKMKAAHQLSSAEKTWITIIEVTLDKNGKVLNVQPLQLAGEWDMDRAPVNAFNTAKNFPNPPAEMVEEDGYIRIRYRFTVNYRPQLR